MNFRILKLSQPHKLAAMVSMSKIDVRKESKGKSRAQMPAKAKKIPLAVVEPVGHTEDEDDEDFEDELSEDGEEEEDLLDDEESDDGELYLDDEDEGSEEDEDDKDEDEDEDDGVDEQGLARLMELVGEEDLDELEKARLGLIDPEEVQNGSGGQDGKEMLDDDDAEEDDAEDEEDEEESEYENEVSGTFLPSPNELISADRGG